MATPLAVSVSFSVLPDELGDAEVGDFHATAGV